MMQRQQPDYALSSTRSARMLCWPRWYGVPLGILLSIIALSMLSGDAEASGSIPIDVTIQSNFTGCSGITATFDLVADAEALTNGIAFEWNQGVTQTSHHLANPNTATTTFSKVWKRVSVTAGNWFLCGQATVILVNPCII